MRARSFPSNYSPWPVGAFPSGMEKAIEQLRDRLLDRLDVNGAVRSPCHSRVLESALLLRLMERVDFTSSQRPRLTAYLASHRNAEDPIDRALARMALAGTAAIPTELTSQLVTAAPDFTRSRKRLMIDALRTLFGAPPLSDVPLQASAFSTVGLHPWAEVQVTAIKVILAGASAQPHLVRPGDIELLRSTQRAPWVWEGHVLVHLLSLHALLQLPGLAHVIRNGIAKALEHQRDDGGVPFVSDIDTWCTSTAGLALSAIGASRDDRAMLAHHLLAQQRANGGWAVTDRALQPDVDSTTVAVEFLRTLDRPECADAIAHGTAFLLSVQDPSGGFPTYVSGAPPEACMTAAAVNALSSDSAGNRKAITQGLNFLARRQHEDGTFGPDWSLSRFHGVFRAMLSTEALGPVLPASVQQMRARMVDSVLRAHNSDGGWGHVAGRPSDALSTSYALITLCWQPDPIPVARGVAFLLDQLQADGSITSVPDMVGPRPFVYTVPVLSDIYALLALGHLLHRTAVVPGPHMGVNEKREGPGARPLLTHTPTETQAFAVLTGLAALQVLKNVARTGSHSPAGAGMSIPNAEQGSHVPNTGQLPASSSRVCWGPPVKRSSGSSNMRASKPLTLAQRTSNRSLAPAECGVACAGLTLVRAEPFTTVARLRDRFGVPAGAAIGWHPTGHARQRSTAAIGFLRASQHTEGTWRRSWARSESSVINYLLDAFGVAEHLASPAIHKGMAALTSRSMAHLDETQNSDRSLGHDGNSASDTLSTAQAIPVITGTWRRLMRRPPRGQPFPCPTAPWRALTTPPDRVPDATDRTCPYRRADDPAEDLLACQTSTRSMCHPCTARSRSRRTPATHTVDLGANEFMRRHDLSPPQEQERISRQLIGAVVGYLVPAGPAELLQVAANLSTLIIAVDDFLDEGPVRLDTAGAATFLARTVRTAAAPELVSDRHEPGRPRAGGDPA